MRKFILTLAIVLLAGSAFAQAPVVANMAADDTTNVAMLIKYYPGVSGYDSAEVAVEADGNLTVLVESAAYTGFECPVSGALGGVIDVSNAACDTYGEVADIINATAENFSTGFFRAVLVDVMRADSTNNTTVAAVSAQATLAKGLAVYVDNSDAIFASMALLPAGCRTDIRCFVTPAGKLLENPFGGKYTTLHWLEGYSTWNTTSNFQIYSVYPSQKASGSEVATLLHQEAAGATGTNKQLTQFQYLGFPGRAHEKMIVRIVDTATGSAFVMSAFGVEKSVNAP